MSSHWPHTLGSLLRDARVGAGLSLRTTASSVGVDYTYLSKVEHDANAPSGALLSRLAHAYAVSEDELLARAGKLPVDIQALIRNHGPAAFHVLRHHFCVWPDGQGPSRVEDTNQDAPDRSELNAGELSDG